MKDMKDQMVKTDHHNGTGITDPMLWDSTWETGTEDGE
jgi:hypothetical protein